MPEKFRISELPTSASFNDADIMEVSQVDNDSPSGFSSVKKTVLDIANKILKNINFTSDLNTTDKTVIGAINEVDGDIPANSDFSLSGLSDTTISSPSSGQMIVYNGTKWVNNSLGKVEVTSQVTFDELVTGTNTRFYTKVGVLYIFYQGESKAHSNGELLFTLPSGLRPTNLIYTTFVASNGINFIFGDISINVDGTCKVAQISDTSGAGRIYFSCAIPLI